MQQIFTFLHDIVPVFSRSSGAEGEDQSGKSECDVPQDRARIVTSEPDN